MIDHDVLTYLNISAIRLELLKEHCNYQKRFLKLRQIHGKRHLQFIL